MQNALLSCPAPDGTELHLAESIDQETEAGFSIDNLEGLKRFYEQEGYAVVRKVIPEALCRTAASCFEREVKPYEGLLYRQPSSGAAERHKFSSTGLMLNSILNLQDLDAKRFPEFPQAALSIVTHNQMHKVVTELLGEEATIVQTMYFEGNPETWPHQDSYYLDSTEIGRMVAAWIAVETIDAGAGRFFVYPRSHKIDVAKHGGNFDIAFNHDRYKQLVIDLIRQNDLKCLAPALETGDVIFWNSKTIHGSLKTMRPERSRCSFTAHYVPQSTGLLQFQRRVMRLHLRHQGQFQVHCPKDQNLLKNRLLLDLESHFPAAFQFLKRLAIKIVTR